MYLNKLLIALRAKQANAHLGLIGAIGAKNSRWSRFSAQRPQSYIFGFRAGQPIIDLEKTVISLRRACHVINLIIRSNGHLLFVNTASPNYNKIIQQTASSTNQSFINHKWIGGFLTNWNHMRNVQEQFHAAAKLSGGASLPLYRQGVRPTNLVSGFGLLGDDRVYSQFCKNVTSRRRVFWGGLPGQNRPSLRAFPRYKKMQKCFEGLPMRPSGAVRPDCVIIFNATQNSTAIYEAHNNQIPIISIVDSNIPNELYNLITYPIPANYDSVQFVYLFCNCIFKTILASR